jgi:hypothetical protein
MAFLVERMHKSREETGAGETLDVQALDAQMLLFSDRVSTEHKQHRFRPRPRGGGMTSRRDAVGR